MYARGDSPACDGQEAQAQRPARPEQLEQAPEVDPALVTARVRREEAVLAPACLVELDEGLEVGQRIHRFGQGNVAGRLGAADLAPNLMTLLLVECREVVIDRAADW